MNLLMTFKPRIKYLLGMHIRIKQYKVTNGNTFIMNDLMDISTRNL